MNDREEILIALRRIMRAISLQSKQLVKQTGLTAPQLMVLNVLKRDGEQSSGAIARSISLSQATVTSILERLERAGLVHRRKADVDRRVVLVGLTPEGRTRVEGAPELLQADFIRKFGALAIWEQHMLIASVQRIAELMDAETIDASPILEVGDVGS